MGESLKRFYRRGLRLLDISKFVFVIYREKKELPGLN